MTDTPTPDPLPPDVVDELLSARADDAFDDAARDFGFTPDEARARLDATPGAAERARAIDAARAALATTPPLDDLRRRRLVANALTPEREPRAGRARRVLLTGAGVAAAIAALVALVSVASFDSPGGDDDSLSAARDEAASGTTAAAQAPRSNAIDDAQQLRRFVEQEVEQRAPAAADASGRPAPSSTSNAFRSSGGSSTQEKGAGELQQDVLTLASRQCLAELHRSFTSAAGPTFTAAVTHKGKPADLALYDQNGGTLAVLYDPANCRILISTFAP
jgi:hypothetical protein